MCTAIIYRHFFGRTLDYERSFGEQPVITPRQYPLRFKRMPPMRRHYALIGMAAVAEDYPLYYEAMNERGLAMAGLLFPGNAVYQPPLAGAENIAPYELIPWLLGQCADLEEAQVRLARLRLAALPFNRELPLSPLHWLIADPTGALAVEATKEGLQVYENPVGVLTNNPPFPQQLLRLEDYAGLTPAEPPGERYSRGLSAFGLPGDLSSGSRFARAAFVKQHSRAGESEAEGLSQFFHILGAVEQQRGCIRLETGDECTRYTACCDLRQGVYYYSTYENRALSALSLAGADLEGEKLLCYPLMEEQQIRWQN